MSADALYASPAVRKLREDLALALRATGVATRTLGAEATWAGLHALSGFLDSDRTPA